MCSYKADVCLSLWHLPRPNYLFFSWGFLVYNDMVPSFFNVYFQLIVSVILRSTFHSNSTGLVYTTLPTWPCGYLLYSWCMACMTPHCLLSHFLFLAFFTSKSTCTLPLQRYEATQTNNAAVVVCLYTLTMISTSTTGAHFLCNRVQALWIHQDFMERFNFSTFPCPDRQKGSRKW